MPSYEANARAITESEAVNNIIVMWESLSAKHMSGFGVDKNTTHWLDDPKSKSGDLKETYPTGLFTDVSIPSFFNIMKKTKWG